jgi:hypothetical protein
MRLPEVCANLCFGGPKRNQLLITASQSIYLLQVNTQALRRGSGLRQLQRHLAFERVDQLSALESPAVGAFNQNVVVHTAH